jgi:hypothetical protein
LIGLSRRKVAVEEELRVGEFGFAGARNWKNSYSAGTLVRLVRVADMAHLLPWQSNQPSLLSPRQFLANFVDMR